MGNELGSEEQNKKIENSQECYLGYCYNTLSYKGIKSEGSEKQSRNSSDKLSEKTTETTEKVSNKASIMFEWNGGGDNVALTGSFGNWQEFYPMTKNDEGIHQLMMTLDPGVYQFKFVIDNQWRCSDAYSMIDDGNHNTNNVINTGSPNEELSSEQTTKESNQQSKEGSSKAKDGFSCLIPKQSEMNTESPAVPFHYIQSFNIDHNTKQYCMGKRKYLNFNERNLLSENNSFKKLLTVPHVNL